MDMVSTLNIVTLLLVLAAAGRELWVVRGLLRGGARA